MPARARAEAGQVGPVNRRPGSRRRRGAGPRAARRASGEQDEQRGRLPGRPRRRPGSSAPRGDGRGRGTSRSGTGDRPTGRTVHVVHALGRIRDAETLPHLERGDRGARGRNGHEKPQRSPGRRWRPGRPRNRWSRAGPPRPPRGAARSPPARCCRRRARRRIPRGIDPGILPSTAAGTGTALIGRTEARGFTAWYSLRRALRMSGHPRRDPRGRSTPVRRAATAPCPSPARSPRR